MVLNFMNGFVELQRSNFISCADWESQGSTLLIFVVLVMRHMGITRDSAVPTKFWFDLSFVEFRMAC